VTARGGLARRVVHALAARPAVFDALRWVLEAGFRGERAVLRREGCGQAGRVLDLGCGTGALAGAFAADRYLGVDPDARYVARARRKHPRHRFAVMDGTRLGLAAGAFEAVVVSGVIHHLDDGPAARLLAEARRVLAPGGRLVAWEDVPVRSGLNVVGRLVQHLDEGDGLRAAAAYLDLVRAAFPDVTAYPMRSGVCDYVVMVARAGAG
jgi:SAM-dependent methyltransferase